MSILYIMAFIRWRSSGAYKYQPSHVALADSGATLTIANLLISVLSGTPTANRTLTLPTAANAVAGAAGVIVDDSFDFIIINKSTPTNSANFVLAAGTGGTIEGNATVNATSNLLGTFFTSGSGKFRMRFTNVSGGTEAYTVYRLS